MNNHRMMDQYNLDQFDLELDCKLAVCTDKDQELAVLKIASNVRMMFQTGRIDSSELCDVFSAELLKVGVGVMENLVGKEVINIHRTSATRVGKILSFETGVNGGTVVQWPDYIISMVTNDLALLEDWPRIDDNGKNSYIRLSSYFGG